MLEKVENKIWRKLKNESINSHKKSRKNRRSEKALEHYLKDVEIIGIPVESNVPEQPVDKDVLGEDKERHNHSGGIQLLTHNKISRIDLTEYAFIMALTKYINGNKWR